MILRLKYEENRYSDAVLLSYLIWLFDCINFKLKCSKLINCTLCCLMLIRVAGASPVTISPKNKKLNPSPGRGGAESPLAGRGEGA